MAVHLERRGDIAIVTIDNPPVNAMNRKVRQALIDLVDQLEANSSITAVILAAAGRVFVGGADISEFDRPVEDPTLPTVIAAIEAAHKLWVAAVHGVALGGGLEIILGCRFRLATPEASFALPEVNLGIIPGAGGTQRLPRLIGINAAIPVIAEMQTLKPSQAVALGLIDHIATGDLLTEAVAYARKAATLPLPPSVSKRPLAMPQTAVWTEAETRIRGRSKGVNAPLRALSVLRFGVENGIGAGLAHERATFLELRATEEAAALRYLFFAERAASRPAHLRGVEPSPVGRLGVVGGGTMGVGITAALRNAGLPVVLIERDEESLARGMKAIDVIFDTSVRKGSLSADEAATRRAGVTGCVGYEGVASCDLVIEAVFEDLAVKQMVFAELARVCRPDAILATNTSYLDPRLIAQSLPELGRFIGLHFFSPAHVMKLLEIVPIPQTRPAVFATAFALARQLGKIPVRSGICDGFIGNRILRQYRAEAELLLRGGVSLDQIDAAMRSYGYAMGPFEMQDLAGLDISFMHREAARARGENVPETPGDILVRAGRKGQKTGGGWYDYRPGERTPHLSHETARLLAPILASPVTMDAEAITDQLIQAMAAEGQTILAEGIATSAADIDLVEVHGYGFPRRHGGPMFLHARRST